MNIFMTHSDPKQAAYDHCTLHRNKMIIEVSQMLSTAHRLLDGDTWADEIGLCKATHVNHPCSKFVRSSPFAYHWTHRHLVYLHEYFEAHNDREHALKRILKALTYAPRAMPQGEYRPVLAANDDIAQAVAADQGVVTGYRCYMNHKFKEWMSRDKPIKFWWAFDQPSWLDTEVANYAHAIKVSRNGH